MGNAEAVEKPAGVDERQHELDEKLYWAEDADEVRELLAAGANPSYVRRGFSVLMSAVARLSGPEAGAELGAHFPDRKVPPEWARSHCGTIVQLLLNAGANWSYSVW